MTGLVRKATLLSVCGLLAAATAFANVPSPGNSDHVDWVKIVGTNGGVVHGGQSIGGVIRDFTNNPIAGSNVVIDLSGCTEMRLCNAVITGAGVVACGPSTVTVQTNAAGQWSVTVVGGANSTGNGIGSGAGCGEIRADGVPINNPSAYVIDINGAPPTNLNGVNAFDLSTMKGDWLKATTVTPYIGRIDYDQNAVINAFDLAAYKTLVLSNGSLSGCDDGIAGVDSYCP